MNFTEINSIKIYSPASREELIEYAMIKRKCLIAVNAEKILNSNKNLKELINQNIGYPDGIGAVWALKKRGFKDSIKIPGCELWLDIIQYFYKVKSFYLVGGKQEVIQKTVRKLRSEYPGINILSFRNGYIKTRTDKKTLLNDIRLRQPDIVFIAMGSPRQELLIQEMQNIHAAVYQGLGGSFDVYVGSAERAPIWWVKNNLEWAYRLIKEPQRILRQTVLITFFIRLITNRL